jgi:endonuclease YncB( thermonuclease family)
MQTESGLPPRPFGFGPTWGAAATVAGRVVGIADGDTLTILDSGNQQHRIRLNGIDERNRPGTSASRT